MLALAGAADGERRMDGRIAQAWDDDRTGARQADVAVVVPYFNEASGLPRTIASLKRQTQPPRRLVLVDNASSDGSSDIAAGCANDAVFAVQHLAASTPGKVHALAAAMAPIRDAPEALVAFCDADTIYPPHYFELAARLFERGGARLAAAMAIGVDPDPYGQNAWRARLKGACVGRILARQCHTGGYGQVFRREIFVEAGGYCPTRWPYVLEDHEIMQRVLRFGRGVYHSDFWCAPSARRRDRTGVSWTLGERLLYHATPFALKDWYFYRFLGRRFAGRGLVSARLRERDW